MVDMTNTHCPYCESAQIGQSRYVYRVVNIGGLSEYDVPLKAVEIYCASCHRTLSITPVNSSRGR